MIPEKNIGRNVDANGNVSKTPSPPTEAQSKKSLGDAATIALTSAYDVVRAAGSFAREQPGEAVIRGLCLVMMAIPLTGYGIVKGLEYTGKKTLNFAGAAGAAIGAAITNAMTRDKNINNSQDLSIPIFKRTENGTKKKTTFDMPALPTLENVADAIHSEISNIVDTAVIKKINIKYDEEAVSPKSDTKLKRESLEATAEDLPSSVQEEVKPIEVQKTNVDAVERPESNESKNTTFIMDEILSTELTHMDSIIEGVRRLENLQRQLEAKKTPDPILKEYIAIFKNNVDATIQFASELQKIVDDKDVSVFEKRDKIFNLLNTETYDNYVATCHKYIVNFESLSTLVRKHMEEMGPSILSEDGKESFASLAIKVIQRIPRHRLLFEDLQKKTEDPQLKGLYEVSVEKVRDGAMFGNNIIKINDIRQIIEQLKTDMNRPKTSQFRRITARLTDIDLRHLTTNVDRTEAYTMDVKTQKLKKIENAFHAIQELENDKNTEINAQTRQLRQDLFEVLNSNDLKWALERIHKEMRSQANNPLEGLNTNNSLDPKVNRESHVKRLRKSHAVEVHVDMPQTIKAFKNNEKIKLEKPAHQEMIKNLNALLQSSLERHLDPLDNKTEIEKVFQNFDQLLESTDYEIKRATNMVLSTVFRIVDNNESNWINETIRSDKALTESLERIRKLVM